MPSTPWMTSKEHSELFEAVKNWGRWGPDDEAGALNLITPEKRAAAAGEVTHGPVSYTHLTLPTKA